MSRTLRRRSRTARVPPAALALALLMGTAAQAGAAEAVVVASTAPGYAQGQVVADGAVVKLPDGAGALFLFATGRTVRVKGPYEGQLDKMPEAAPRTAMGGLLSGDRFMQSELGATRAVGNPLERGAELAFALDPAASGAVCVRADAPPTLKRPRDPALNSVSLRETARGASATVGWESAATVPWPKDLPLHDGGEVQVSGPDGKPLGTLRLRAIDAGSDRGAALAVKLAAAGCRAQAAALLTPLRDAMAPLDVYLSTDRGSSAAYAAGEAVRLVLQTNRDAHVYCYVRNARGQLIPIFPTGASSPSLVEGNMPLTMPGERMPMPLRIAEPAGGMAGDMEVRCFAAERDLGSDLPGRNEAFHPLNEDTVARLDQRLGSLRDTEIVMAQVILRVK